MDKTYWLAAVWTIVSVIVILLCIYGRRKVTVRRKRQLCADPEFDSLARLESKTVIHPDTDKGRAENERIIQANSFVAKRVSYFENETQMERIKAQAMPLPKKQTVDKVKQAAAPVQQCNHGSVEIPESLTVAEIKARLKNEAEMKQLNEKQDFKKGKNSTEHHSSNEDIRESKEVMIGQSHDDLDLLVEEKLQLVECTEEWRRDVAKEAELRRLDLYSSAYHASANPKEMNYDLSVDLSSELFLKPNVFRNQGASVIANMHDVEAETTQQSQHQLTAATNEYLPHHIDPNWSKEKMAKFKKFNKKDKKMAKLIKKVIKSSDGGLKRDTLLSYEKEMAPSQSELDLMPDKN